MATAKQQDRLPEEYRQPLLKEMLVHAGIDGWNARAFAHAADACAISPEMAELAYPRGSIEVLEAHLADADQRLSEALDAADLPSMKIRDRITFAVRTRLEQAAPHRAAVQAATATLALPLNSAIGLQALAHTVDLMWRAAGDTATDYNWYTKRMTLAAVHMATLAFWFTDDSENFAKTWAFLDRRIATVMTIETAKYKLRQHKATMPSLKRFLDHLRRKP